MAEVDSGSVSKLVVFPDDGASLGQDDTSHLTQPQAHLESSSPTTSSEHETYKVYTRRWLMLAVVALFNFSNGMIWISYAPITNYAVEYYDVSLTDINWFSLVYFITFIPCGLLSFWVIDSIGLKLGVLIGTWLNALGALVKLVSSLASMSSKYRFAIALLGQVLCGCAQPMALSMPTKLSAFWFGDRERTLANTISSLANPVGVLVINIMSPLLVQHAAAIQWMVIVLAVPATLVALLATFGFRSDKPPTPPSASPSETKTPFKIVLAKALSNKNYVILMITIGYGIGVFSSFSTLVFQIVCPRGYTNLTAGIAGALVIVGGLFGSTITSLYVDRTKKFEETTKVMALLICISTAALMIVSNLYDQVIALCFVCFFFGYFALGTLPVSLELGVEITYPLAEATTAGLQWMTGQVFGVIILLIVPYLGRDLDSEELKHSTCTAESSATIDTGKVQDLLYVNILMASSITLVVILFTIFFKADLRRLKMEFTRRKLNISDDEVNKDKVLS